MKTDEELLFFKGSKKRSLFGMLHFPNAVDCKMGFVFCHPFAEEKNMSHRVVVNTSRMFAARGISVLRIDMSGCGDSEGDLDNVSVFDWIEDIHSGVNVLKENTKIENCGLWGLRLGAGLALHAAQENKTFSHMILWQPALDFRNYIHEFVRRKVNSRIIAANKKILPVENLINQLKGGNTVHVFGYPISKKLYKSFERMNNDLSWFLPTCPTLILTSALSNHSPRSLKPYFDFIVSNDCDVEVKHIVEEPFWDRNWRWDSPQVSKATIAWILKLMQGNASDGRAGKNQARQ